MSAHPGSMARVVAGALPRRDEEISCVIPVYNGEGTLARTLDSLRAQTMPDWHAIVVDDGSTDASVQLAASYAERDARLCVATKPNGGVASARNAGLGFARGRFVHQLDADDWLAPDAYRALIATADRAGANAAAGSFNVTDDRGADGGETIYEHINARESIDRTALVSGVQLWTGAHIVAGGLARRVLYDETLVGYEDLDCWVRLAEIGARWACTAERVAFHRIRGGSLTKRCADMIDCGRRVLRAHGAEEARIAELALSYATAMALDGDAERALDLYMQGAPGTRVQPDQAASAVRFAVIYHLGQRPVLEPGATPAWMTRARAWWGALVESGVADAGMPDAAGLALAHQLVRAEVVCAELLSRVRAGSRIVVFGHGRNGRALVRAALDAGHEVEVRDDRLTPGGEAGRDEVPAGMRVEAFDAPVRSGDSVVVTPIEDGAMLGRVRNAAGNAVVVRWREVLDQIVAARPAHRRSA